MCLKRPRTLLSAFGLSILLAVPSALAATPSQSDDAAQAAARITAAVDNAVLTTLRGNTHPLAQPRYDLGPASTVLPTGTLQLLLRRSPERQAALRQYLDSLQDPLSPNYHKWLTPQQYGAQFGISDQDMQTVESWLQSQGFKIDRVPGSRNFVQFSGTIGQVDQAFHTSIHSYSILGAQHVGNATDPAIPVALAPVIAGISPLNDFRAQPQDLVSAPSQARRTSSGVLQVLSRSVHDASPLLESPSGNTLYITPADAATLYNSPNTFNSNYAGGTQQTGSGVNIGIAGYSDLQQTDYANYRKLFLNEANPPQATPVPDGVDPGVLDQHDGQETLIDAEIAAGLAPGANLYVYSSQSNLMDDGLTDAIIRAIQDNTVAVLSVSYSACEGALGVSGNYEYNELWQQAAAQGIAVVVAAGNNGSAACDTNQESAATGGVAVNGFASTPYNVAVGGTDLDVLATNLSQYVHGSGSVAPSQASITGYIPENVWNDSIGNNPPGSFSTNVPGAAILAAGGGGASSNAYCAAGADVTSGTCPGSLSGYPTPPFQSGISAGAAAPAGVRYLPDVALFAGTNRQYPATWALCSDSVVAQGDYTFTDCSPTADGTFSVEGVGGMETSTAAFAGVLGMVIQSLGDKRVGVANNILYNLYATSSNRAAVFHDVTEGNNSVPCAAGSPNCGGNGFLTGYDAGTGYDLASGLGSVDISALVTAWSTAVFSSTTTTLQAGLQGAQLSTAPLTITHGQAVTLAATVNSEAATGVSITDATPNGPDVAENIPLIDGAGQISRSDLPGGSYSIQAYYPGDATHAPSTSAPIQITVSPENSVLALTTQITDVDTSAPENSSSFPYGSYGFVYAQPQSVNGPDGTPTGTVTLLNNGTNLSSQPLNSKGTAAFPVAALPPGSYSLTATYSGDGSYNSGSTTKTTAFTVSKGATQLAAVPAASTIDASASTTVTVTLSTDSTGAFPQGTIALAANGVMFSGTVAEVRTVINSDEEIATFTVAGSALASGANTLTATYPGDTNYGGSSATATITVTGTIAGNPLFTLIGPAGGITVATPGTPETGTVTVAGLNGFTGTVNLACSLAAGGYANPPTCSITPSVALTSGSSAAAILTINTTAAATASLTGPESPGNTGIRGLVAGGTGVAFCSLLLFVSPSRRRAWRSMLLVLLGFAAVGTIGCGIKLGPGYHGGAGSSAGTYTVTVTGTSGAGVVTAQVPVTVP